MTPLSEIPPAMVLWSDWMPVGPRRDRAGVGDAAGEARDVVDGNADAARDRATGVVGDAAREGRDAVTPMPSPPPETVPLLVMPPVKVGPVIKMAVRVETILLGLLILMPWYEPVMTPLSVMPPAMVLVLMIMLVALPEIVPALEMLPVKVETPWMTMPPPAAIVPLELLTIPPEKLVTPLTKMPSPAAEILPALEMPPVKVGPVIEMAVAAEVILLVLSRVMPTLPPVALMMPLSRIEPVIVPPESEMPPEAMVPALEMLPEKLVLVTVMQETWPLLV